MSGTSNKPRLYMAYFWRGALTQGDCRYHTTLLLLPKGADANSAVANAVRYHVNEETSATGKTVWKFAAENSRAKTYTLRALVFLGKLRIDVAEFKDMLATIPLKQDEPQWRCRHWVWSALELLSDKGVIDSLSVNPETVWDTGLEFVEAYRLSSTATSKGVVPTCTIEGKEIKSALDGA